jgi:hypothetical protein
MIVGTVDKEVWDTISLFYERYDVLNRQDITIPIRSQNEIVRVYRIGFELV